MIDVRIQLDAVELLMREVAEAVVLPRHRQLRDGDVQEKSPGELVTVADREAEHLLAAGLDRLLPGTPVLGEEAAAEDPRLLTRVQERGPLWLIDPIDGTSAFVDGSDGFAMMLALVDSGDTVAAWIHHPVSGATYRAERGAGAYVDGGRLTTAPSGTARSSLRGTALTRFLPEDLKRSVEQQCASMPHVSHGPAAAGLEYPSIAAGLRDFTLFWRTLPWDHAPGALLVTEAGGTVRHLDGRAYSPGRPQDGLLAAVDEQTWTTVLDELRIGV